MNLEKVRIDHNINSIHTLWFRKRPPNIKNIKSVKKSPISSDSLEPWQSEQHPHPESLSSSSSSFLISSLYINQYCGNYSNFYFLSNIRKLNSILDLSRIKLHTNFNLCINYYWYWITTQYALYNLDRKKAKFIDTGCQIKVGYLK